MCVHAFHRPPIPTSQLGGVLQWVLGGAFAAHPAGMKSFSIDTVCMDCSGTCWWRTSLTCTNRRPSGNEHSTALMISAFLKSVLPKTLLQSLFRFSQGCQHPSIPLKIVIKLNCMRVTIRFQNKKSFGSIKTFSLNKVNKAFVNTIFEFCSKTMQ